MTHIRKSHREISHRVYRAVCGARVRMGDTRARNGWNITCSRCRAIGDD